jgi:hypothetical protein
LSCGTTRREEDALAALHETEDAVVSLEFDDVSHEKREGEPERKTSTSRARSGT